MTKLCIFQFLSPHHKCFDAVTSILTTHVQKYVCSKQSLCSVMPLIVSRNHLSYQYQNKGNHLFKWTYPRTPSQQMCYTSETKRTSCHNQWIFRLCNLASDAAEYCSSWLPSCHFAFFFFALLWCSNPNPLALESATACLVEHTNASTTWSSSASSAEIRTIPPYYASGELEQQLGNSI